MNTQNNNNKIHSIQKFKQSDFQSFEKEAVPFTMFSNHVIQGMTRKDAGFLWVYLQSLPPTWIPNVNHLAQHFGDSTRTIERLLAILKACNLTRADPQRDEYGRITGWKLIILNGSQFIPYTDDIQTAKSKKTQTDKFVGLVTDVVKPAPAGDFIQTDKNPQCGVLSYIEINTTNKEIKKNTTTQELATKIEEVVQSEPESSSISFSLQKSLEELAELNREKKGVGKEEIPVMIEAMRKQVEKNVRNGWSLEEAVLGLNTIITEKGGFNYNNPKNISLPQRLGIEIAAEQRREDERKKKEYDSKKNIPNGATALGNIRSILNNPEHKS